MTINQLISEIDDQLIKENFAIYVLDSVPDNF